MPSQCQKNANRDAIWALSNTKGDQFLPDMFHIFLINFRNTIILIIFCDNHSLLGCGDGGTL